MKTLFPGTFDPPTLGHLDIIERATPLCDKLYVAVACSEKEAIFSVEERVEMLKKIAPTNVEVTSFSGLTVDFAKEHGISFLVRGLRAFSDVEHEFRLAIANRKLQGIETLFLVSSHSHISSTLIREIGREGHTLIDFVPKAIERQVRERLK